jgi:hypothetical protein
VALYFLYLFYLEKSLRIEYTALGGRVAGSNPVLPTEESQFVALYFFIPPGI